MQHYFTARRYTMENLTHLTNKEWDRQQIQKHIQDFLANGGKVNILPRWSENDLEKRTQIWYNESLLENSTAY